MPRIPEHSTLEVPLRNLFLDPNNFRFADHPEYRDVAEDKLTDAQAQKRTLRIVLGQNLDGVEDLIDSLRKSGWLPVDQIQVRPLGQDRYLVVEGNRRVAALKYLQDRYEEAGLDLEALDPAIFEKVPVVTYLDRDPAHYLVLMGLKHVSGNKKWPSVNQARMLRKLREEHKQSPEDICKGIGISRQELNLSLRSLKLCDLYRESDYGDQFQSAQYNLFREIARNPKIREWLDWDDRAGTAGNAHNLARLFGWLSADETEEDEESPRREPAISTGAQVRELVKIIDDPKALERLDQTRSLSEAREGSSVLLRSRVLEALDECERCVNVLFQLSTELEEQDLDRAEQLVSRLRGVCAVRNRFPAVFQSAASGMESFNQFPKVQFTDILIERYRGLKGLKLPALSRVNMLAGLNNAGKTSVLEAVHLLARQHDVTGLLDVVQKRARIAGDPEPQWLIEQLPRSARIAGAFDQAAANKAEVEIAFERDAEVEDRAFYLGTLTIEATYGGRSQRSSSTFYEKRDRRTQIEGTHVLCRSFLSSPFSLSDPDLLAACNKRSVETRSKERIISFLREHVDGGLVSIEMVDKSQRFLVNHNTLEQSLDLTQFGDGMQRVFLMCLLFSWAEHGVLLLDEFENAIHAALLPALARFVIELAGEFNVQVFLASHSKEAIDAFAKSGAAGGVSGYSLIRHGREISAQHYDGVRLSKLIDVADFDMRMAR
ncbi:MAG TPA: AAA family ATPase [Sorangium sp.]|nr:AAA family ATPase [Sorangium sp.]